MVTTRLEQHQVPAWVVIHRDGRGVRQRKLGKTHPTGVWIPGSILAVMLGPAAVVLVYPGPNGVPSWTTTVDVRQDGRKIRRCGPGIQSPDPVRLWISPEGWTVLVDGPVERAIDAHQRYLAWQSL